MKFVITDASQYASGKKGLSPEYIDKLKDKYTLETIRAKTVFNDIEEEWTINLFSHYDEKDKAFPFICINDFYRYCIPYEGNEYLVGKTVNIKKI